MAFAERRGKWWRGRYLRPDGSYGSISEGFATKKAALEAANDEESRIRHNSWIDPRVADIRFEDFANQWHATAAQRLSPTTVDKYRRYLDGQLIPKWGEWSMISIFNSHFEIEDWVTKLHAEYEESSVASYFGCFSTIMNVAVKARVIPANPCTGVKVTSGEWETEKYVATPVQVLRAAMRLYESGLGLSGFTLGLVNAYAGARWGEIAGQTVSEYDSNARAIGVFAPLKEVKGRLIKGGSDVTDKSAYEAVSLSSGRPRRARRGMRTKSPAGERWVQLPSTVASIYELLLVTKARTTSFAFVSLRGGPWYRSNFRQRFWRPVWDGFDVANPASDRHRPAILPGFRFHEGRHTHASWLTADGVPEVARRARLGQKMKGMARVYDHVTPEMERQIRDALDARFVASVLELTESERALLLSWVPVIEPTVTKAMQEAKALAANVVGGGRFSQISPMEARNENRSGSEDAS